MYTNALIEIFDAISGVALQEQQGRRVLSNGLLLINASFVSSPEIRTPVRRPSLHYIMTLRLARFVAATHRPSRAIRCDHRSGLRGRRHPCNYAQLRSLFPCKYFLSTSVTTQEVMIGSAARLRVSAGWAILGAYTDTRAGDAAPVSISPPTSTARQHE